MDLRKRFSLIKKPRSVESAARFESIMRDVLPGYKPSAARNKSLEAAMKLLGRRRLAPALRRFNSVIKKSPEPRALSGRALCWWEKADYGRALADLDRAVKADGENENLLVLRSQLKSEIASMHRAGYRASDRLRWYGLDEPDRDWGAEAVADLTRAIAVKPDAPPLYVERALANIYRDDYPAALADCDRALELGRDDSELRTHRALALFNLDRPEEAAADARLAVDKGHRDAWPKLILGWIAASEEDYRGAMTHFRAALAADRKSHHALANIGRCYTELGDFNKASDFIDRALKAEPYDAYGHYALALWFERQDSPGEALWTCLNAALTCPADSRLMEKISELILKGVYPAEPD
ncbi:MAG: hypothetical protein FD189_1781 [Elusimicrobia bacterium]|nr:MAG: hypothetical protein FD154_1924 [Elusimicrobiota bacterium]KAF0154597.1 MAG: hypothetical protein FD189_1781 [Elusimicrobiota bacterium]